MSTYLDRLNEKCEKDIKRDIEEANHEIALITARLSFLEEQVRNPVDYARMPQENGGKSINDVDDREKLLHFLEEKVWRSSSRSSDSYLGLFWHYSNVPTLCEQHGVECPQWFIEKYCV